MDYFVTGATGFIGKRLVRKLLARRGAVVHFLVRDASPEKLEPLYAFWGVDESRAIPVVGDLAQPGSASGRPSASGSRARSTTSSTLRPSTT